MRACSAANNSRQVLYYTEPGIGAHVRKVSQHGLRLGKVAGLFWTSQPGRQVEGPKVSSYKRGCSGWGSQLVWQQANTTAVILVCRQSTPPLGSFDGLPKPLLLKLLSHLDVATVAEKPLVVDTRKFTFAPTYPVSNIWKTRSLSLTSP